MSIIIRDSDTKFVFIYLFISVLTINSPQNKICYILIEKRRKQSICLYIINWKRMKTAYQIFILKMPKISQMSLSLKSVRHMSYKIRTMKKQLRCSTCCPNTFAKLNIRGLQLHIPQMLMCTCHFCDHKTTRYVNKTRKERHLQTLRTLKLLNV